MARDISIAISAKDNFSDSIKKMQGMQTAFRKDLGKLNKELTTMNKNKVELKVDVSKAKNDLKEAEKSFKKLGDEASRNKLIMAQTDYDTVKKNLDLVSQGAKQTEREIRNLTDTMTKSESKSNNFSSQSGTLGTLAKAGLTKMVGDSLSGALGTATTSALGSSVGSSLSSIASGAMTGAAIGSIIPGIGTAIGTAVGAVAGTINAVTQTFSEKDDNFKLVVQSNYEMTKATKENSKINGSNLSGNLEQSKISFSTLLGGDDLAEGFLANLTKFAANTPFEFEQLTTMSKTLLAYGYKFDEIIPLLASVGDGGSALGMSGDDMNSIATMLGRMQTTGKTTLEYLNPIMERGIPVLDFLAESLGVAKESVLEMVSDGLIPGAQAAQIIADAMGETYSGNMDKQSQTFAGLTSTLQDMQNEMDKAMGEAYNEKRKEGLQAEIDFLGGESGEKMKTANAMIGEWQASLENEHDKAIRDAMDSMMAAAEYKTAEAEGDKVKMGELLARAQVEGENAYKATQGYQEQLASDLALIGKIREDTALKSEYYNTGYVFGQEFSKGLAAAKSVGISTTITNPNQYYSPESLPLDSNKHANGLSYVPYDNYPALLHQGERVLTANQSRQEGGNGGITITGNSFTIREEADINKIALALANEMVKVKMNHGGL